MWLPQLEHTDTYYVFQIKSVKNSLFLKEYLNAPFDNTLYSTAGISHRPSGPAWWHRPVILATQKIETEGLQVQGYLSYTLSFQGYPGQLSKALSQNKKLKGESGI